MTENGEWLELEGRMSCGSASRNVPNPASFSLQNRAIDAILDIWMDYNSS
jgi:hypothetical protein